MKTLTALTLALLASSSLAQAGSYNAPDLSQPVKVGRIEAFPTVHSAVWFPSMAFSSELDCSPEGHSQSRSCILRIYNRLTNDEQTGIRNLVKPGQVVLAFRDVDPVTQSIAEHFEDLKPELQSGFPLLQKTLALDDQHPYASIGFRADADAIDQLLQSYNEEGLGKFVSEVTFSGQITEDYIAVQDSSPVRKVMESTIDHPLRSLPLKTALKEALSRSGLVLKNYDHTEALSIGAATLLINDFEMDRHGEFRVRPQKLTNLPKKLVLVEETYSPVKARCKATLLLKKDALSTLECAQEDQ